MTRLLELLLQRYSRSVRALYRRWLAIRSYWRIAIYVVLFVTVVRIHGPSLLAEAVVALLVLDSYVGPRVRRGERLDAIGLGREGALAQCALGGVLAAGLMTATILVFAARDWYDVVDVGADPGQFVLYVLLFACVAIVEEVLTRGMIWRMLERRFGSFVALLATSILFGLAHLPNPNASLRSAMAISMEAGLFLGALFLLNRSLWAPLGAHFAWNLFEGPVFGTPVSGLRTEGLIDSVTRGPLVWTGGRFGPENGYVTMIIGGLAAIVLAYIAYRRKNFEPPKFELRPREGITAASPEAT